MYINLSPSAARQISKSNKTFILYRLNQQENKVIDYVLTDNLSRFRDAYNNNFKLVADVKKQINNNLKIQL
jgi:hypothetical protein